MRTTFFEKSEPRQRINREDIGNIWYSDVNFRTFPAFDVAEESTIIVKSQSIPGTIGLEQLCRETLYLDCNIGIIGMPIFRRKIPDPDLLLRNLRSWGISIANPVQIQSYLYRYPNLSPILLDIAFGVKKNLPDASLSLEIVSDPEEVDVETLVLYLQPSDLKTELFEKLERWNSMVAERLVSEAWFIINLDLRKRG